MRELERLLGRKTMEVETYQGSARRRAGKKTELAAAIMERSEGRFAMKAVADTLAVARSNLIEQVSAAPSRVGPIARPGTTAMALIRRLVDERQPTVWHSGR